MTIAIVTATIAARGTITPAVAITGPIIGIIMPAGWAPAVVVSVQGSADGVNFYDLYDGVTAKELSFNVKQNSMVAISPNRLCCCTAIKLRSGTTSSPVMQPIACQFSIIVQAP
jgi:hypothetical protein